MKRKRLFFLPRDCDPRFLPSDSPHPPLLKGFRSSTQCPSPLLETSCVGHSPIFLPKRSLGPKKEGALLVSSPFGKKRPAWSFSDGKRGYLVLFADNLLPSLPLLTCKLWSSGSPPSGDVFFPPFPPLSPKGRTPPLFHSPPRSNDSGSP